MVRKKKSLYGYQMILPAILIYVVFFIAPAIYGVYYSLTDWTIGKSSVNFVGIQNYIKVFQESELRKAIGNTFLYTFVVVVFKNLFGLLLALAFNLNLKTRNYLRAVTFLPCILSSVVIGLVFVPILHSLRLFKYLFGSCRPWLYGSKLADKCKYRYVKHCGSIYLAVDRLSYGNLSRRPARDIKGVL